MRNLKKILALVLALVMSMSLVTIANASDFTDSDKITYDEAVDVMSAIGVLNGLETGAFNPTGTLTREQAAKIICTMLLGENAEKLGVTSTGFKDVPATRWSAPYVAYCASIGIIAGNGDGTYNPTGKLTGYAFAKMLLGALGYDAGIEKYTGAGWSIEVAKGVVNTGLDKKLGDVLLSSYITREQAAQMALNTLTADIVEYDNKGSSIDLGNGVVINQGASKAEAVTSTQSWAGNINKDGVTTPSTTTPYTVQFGEKYFSDLKLNASLTTDNFGAPANVWTYKDFTGKYAKDAILTYTDSVKANELADDIEDAGYKVDKTSDDASKPSLTISSNGKSVTYKGTDVASAITAKTKFGGQGIELKVYDANDDDVADTIVLTYVYAAKVKNVTKDDADTKADERALTVEAYMGNDKTPTLTLNKDTAGFDAVYSAVEKDDIVLVTPKNDSSSADAAWTVALPTSVTGAVTAVKSDSITVGGTAYDIAACERAVSTSNLNADKDVVLYLDAYGNAIYTTAVAATSSIDAVYVTAAWTGAGTWGSTKMFQGVLTDGTVITGEYKFEDDGAVDYAETLENADLNKLYKYEKDGDTYKLIAGTTDGSAAQGIGTMQVTSAIDKTDRRLTTGQKNYFDSEVNFVFVTGKEGDIKVTVKSGVQTISAQAAGTYAVISKDADSNLVVTTVFVNTAATSASSDLIYIAKAWASTSTDVKYGNDGKTKLYGYEAYVNGEKTTVYVETQGTKAVGFYSYTVDDVTGAYTLTTEGTGVAVEDTVSGSIGYVGGKYYISLTTKTEVADFDATDAKVIDTRTDGKVDTMSELKDSASSVKVSVIYDKDKETVSYIFVAAK